MGIVFRQSIKTTIVTLIGTLLGALTIYLYTIVLNQQVNGFVRNMFNYASLLQIFAVIGTAGTVYTYILQFPEGNQRNTIFTLCLFVPLCSIPIALVPYIIFEKSIVNFYQAVDRPLVRSYYYLMPILVFLWSYMTLFEYFLVGQHKTALAIFMREIVLRLLNIIIIFLFCFNVISFPVFIVSSVMVYIIPSLLMVVVALKMPHFKFTLQLKSLTRQDYKSLIQFSWYHLLMGVSIVAMATIDSNILGILSPKGLSSVAIYTTSIFIAALASVPYRAMSAAVSPTFNAAYIEGDTTKLQNLFNRSAINALIISILMIVIIVVNLHNAVAILKPEYKLVAPIVLIMMLGKLADTGSGFNTEVINVSKYYKYNFRISAMLLVLVIILCVVLIPCFDIYGAAWATTIALTFFNIAKAIFAYRQLRLQPFSINTILVLFSGTIALLVGYSFMKFSNPFIDTFIRTALIVIVYGAMLLWLKPSEDLTTYLKSIRENKRLF